jgi:ABC-type uncharacterized transport system ATPase subunit
MLAVRDISKRFGPVEALDGVSLDFRAGEVHAVLGENGAGKSTLMHVLSGLCQPDAGSVQLDGRRLDLSTPQSARRAGIGMVHQHFTLVERLTVAENLVLSLPDRPRLALSRSRLAQSATQIAARLDLDIGDPEAVTGTLAVGTRQRIEIVKALAYDARVLILDEPTAVLTRGEIDQLFSLLRQLRDAGRVVVFITHKLREVTDVADRVTVMRRGRVVTTREAVAIGEGEMAELMVGVLAPPVTRLRATVAPGAPDRLSLSSLSTAPDGGRALRSVSLTVRAGEVFGIAGVAGNGQQELFEVLVGSRTTTEGEIRVDGQEVRLTSPAAASAAGIGHIPPDRQQEGLVLPMSVADNCLLNCGVLAHLRRGPFLSGGEVRTFADDLVRRHSVQTESVDAPAATLSGGNQQRLIVGRQLFLQPKVLIAANPTRGLDVAAARSVHDALSAFAASGRAVLLISGDLDEVLDLSHRLAVLHAGRLSQTLSPTVSGDRLGRLMAGVE